MSEVKINRYSTSVLIKQDMQSACLGLSSDISGEFNNFTNPDKAMFKSLLEERLIYPLFLIT